MYNYHRCTISQTSAGVKFNNLLRTQHLSSSTTFRSKVDLLQAVQLSTVCAELHCMKVFGWKYCKRRWMLSSEKIVSFTPVEVCDITYWVQSSVRENDCLGTGLRSTIGALAVHVFTIPCSLCLYFAGCELTYSISYLILCYTSIQMSMYMYMSRITYCCFP